MKVPFNRNFGARPIHDRMDHETPWKPAPPIDAVSLPTDPDQSGGDMDLEDQMALAQRDHEKAVKVARQALADGAVSIDTPVFEPRGKSEAKDR